MTSVRVADSNAYDVLGVSPKASTEEINTAFHQLIEEGGYRVGVPLRGQWLRARQIKDAYAAVGDPTNRRAYDKSLKDGSERPLWPATAHAGPAEAALVRPLSEWQPPREPMPKPIPDALGSGDGEAELVPVEENEPGRDDIVPDEDQAATFAEDDSGPTVIDYGLAKRWGGATAAALAIGALAYITWPSGQPQPPGSEMAALPPWAQKMVERSTTGRPAPPPPAVEQEGSFGEAVPEESAGRAPGSEGLTVSVETGGTAGSTVSVAPTEVAAANPPQTDPGGSVASGGTAPSVAAPALAPSSSGQTSSVSGAAAAASPGPALVPPGAQASTSPAAHAAGEVRSPAQLIGGGPTRADNPRGRHVGTVVVQFTVQADGRVSNCGPVRSSGKADLDAFTCRLVEQRMRFNPALDTQGNPVSSTAHARYEWGRRRRHPSLLSWMLR